MVVCKRSFHWVLNHQFNLQPGSFDLVGSIVYEIDKTPYQSTFYNGTIEVVEASGLFSIETVFLVMLAIGLVAALGLWIHGQLQRFSKVRVIYMCPCAPDLLANHSWYYASIRFFASPLPGFACIWEIHLLCLWSGVLQISNMNVLAKLLSWLLAWVWGDRVSELE